MKNNQISLQLAMRQMRFFNERPGSSKNNDLFFRRMWAMYPETSARIFKTPYDFAMVDAERAHREKPMHTKTNPLKF